jgi:transcription antitermination factor NusG
LHFASEFREGGRGWHVVNRTLGVLRMITFGENPARCSRSRNRESQESNDRRAQADHPTAAARSPPSRLRQGELVRIISGPLAGLSAIHTGMTAHQRELVLIALLGAHRPVAIARDRIAAA